MAVQDHNHNFEAFAKHLAEQPGEAISLQDAIAMWDSRDEDTRAIQEAIDSYESGERGRPVDEFLAERRAARAKKLP